MKKNSIWVTGASGRIGKRLVSLLKKDLNNKVIATDKDVDITDLTQVEKAFELYRPNIIINCASLSDAEYCESHMVEAFKVNALGARNLASVSRQYNARIIHLSTDDVFCGENNRSKNEFDVPTPSTVYGKSKFAGENYIRELNPKHLIIRSSWVYGTGGVDYVTYVLDKAKKGESFEAALDKISTPTSAAELANFILVMIDNREYGIYHASDEGMVTRHQFAVKILRECGYDPNLAVGIFTGKTGMGNTVSTVLDNLMLKMTGIYQMPEWEKDLEAYLANEVK